MRRVRKLCEGVEIGGRLYIRGKREFYRQTPRQWLRLINRGGILRQNGRFFIDKPQLADQRLRNKEKAGAGGMNGVGAEIVKRGKGTILLIGMKKIDKKRFAALGGGINGVEIPGKKVGLLIHIPPVI